MSDEEQLEQARRAGIYESPDTPGFHMALVGGGLAGLGSPVSVCTDCGVLVAYTDTARAAHVRWHQDRGH